MFQQVTLLIEGLVAEIASEGLLSGVNQLVPFAMPRGLKLLPAVLAANVCAMI